MRITESKLRRIIRQVIVESADQIDCVVKYKDGERFEGPCSVGDLMQKIENDADKIKNVFIDEMHAGAASIEEYCKEKRVMCIAGVM